MKELERKLARDDLSWKHEKHHIACLNHVINLVIEAFLKLINVVNTNENKHDEDNQIDEDNNDNDQNDEDDEIDKNDKDENDDDMNMEVEDNSILTIMFKITMKKIHKII